MHSTLALVALSGFAAAVNHQVQVGPDGDYFGFQPTTVTAKKGDTIQFTWNGGAHSVTQGDPNNGCAPSGASAFNSGSIKTGSWTVTINDTNPIYYYCAVNRHCQMGMVGGINLPSTIDDYKSKCAAASNNVLPSAVQGGSNGAPSAAASSSSSSGTAKPSVAASSSSSSSSTSHASTTRSGSTTSTRTGTATSSTGLVASLTSAVTSATGTSTGAAMATKVAGMVVGLPFALAALL